MEGRRERKIVTVLFADLVGFTTRSEELDPEDVDAILSRYHARLRSELERHGGTVEKFIGDAVMALFGAPVGHEDDPERAVRAALAIRDAFAEDGGLELRIAVNTGEALITLDAEPREGQGMAAGDVVNTTARLQAAAPRNGILVGEATYRATLRAIDYRGHAPVEAKGKADPVPVWEAVEARARFGVDVAEVSNVPLVGRERERELLAGALTRAREDATPQLVTVVGAPGLGKSRLVQELFAIVDAAPELIWWRQGRALSYGEGVTYWALAEMVKGHAGILGSDPPEQVAGKLRAALEGREDAEWLELHLRPLVGLSGGAGADDRGEAFAAWRRFFESLAEERPLVLVFEDLHWADDGVLDFIDHLVDWAAGVPILVVATARPELLERRPGWGGGKRNATTISLSPLSRPETAKLIAVLLDRAVLPAETQEALLARAEGNPLYAEEYVRMLSDRGDGDLPVPETLQGMIGARLDALPVEEKALVHDAAVVGKVFWLGALVGMGGGEAGAVEASLHALTRKEFVRRERRSSIAGDVEYAFLHALVREVAYGQIPRAARGEKHERAAAWMEALGHAEDAAEMVAHHYLSALEYARSAGGEWRRFVDPAVAALTGAGDRAASLSAMAAANRYYGAAIDLVPEDDPRWPRLVARQARIFELPTDEEIAAALRARDRLVASGEHELAGEIETALAESYWERGDRASADVHLDAAVELFRGAPPSPAVAKALSAQARLLMLGGASDAAVDIGRQARDLAEKLGLDAVVAAATISIGTARFNRGEPGALDDLERGIELARSARHPLAIHRGLNNLAELMSHRGDLAATRRLYAEQRAAHAEYGSSARHVLWTDSQEASLLYAIGEWDAALSLFDSYLEHIDAGEPHYLESQARLHRAAIRHARGDAEGAFADGFRGLDAARAAADPQSLTQALTALAANLVERGRRTEAERLVDEALRVRDDRGRFGYFAHLIELGWLAHDLGRSDDYLAIAQVDDRPSPWLDAGSAAARGDFLEAASILDRCSMRTDAARMRLLAAESFAGTPESVQQLRLALEFYRSVAATHYVRRGEALLAATA